MLPTGLLPVHGFALAGGKSTRMGRDKALLPFLGRPMVEIAVGKLRSFCAEVSIAGSRADLQQYAPVVPDVSVHIGPAGGMQAALGAHAEPAREQWSLFLPVDAPLVPRELLRRWAEAVLQAEREGVRLSFLRAAGIRQPATAMVHRDAAEAFRHKVAEGMYKLGRVYELVAAEMGTAAVWMAEAEEMAGASPRDAETVERWFSNVNTPEELADAEAWAVASGCHVQGVAGGEETDG